MQSNYKKRIRLKNFDYKGSYRYFITLCTFNKKPILTDNSLILWLVKTLREKAKVFKFKIWAYCFMPDHVHLLLEGNDYGSELKRFISSYKQSTSFYYKRRTGFSLWQINFYEHVLRKEEDTKSVAYYILGNPVRKGLAEDYKNYKFLGSFEFDIMQM